MEPDQPFYDTLFRMAGACIFFAREVREAKERSTLLLERALIAEARARCLEIERDYWKRQTLQDEIQAGVQTRKGPARRILPALASAKRMAHEIPKHQAVSE